MVRVVKVKPHSLDDIRVIFARLEMHNVNPKGEAFGLPQREKDAEARGYTCRRCNVDFRQWSAVLAHVAGMQTMENQRLTDHTPSQGRRVRVFSQEEVTRIIQFSRDVMGVKISEQQALVAARIMKNPDQVLVRQSRNSSANLCMRIAHEYKEFKR